MSQSSLTGRRLRVAAWCAAALVVAGCAKAPPDDLLILGGQVYDGSGAAPRAADVGVKNGRITIVGRAGRRTALDTVDAGELMVTPGFIDMHSHAELDRDYGRDGLPFLMQGITTVVLGVDGDGDPEVGEQLEGWRARGIGLNALLYVGHGPIRRRVMGMADRRPTPRELEQMQALVRQGMEGGAFGFSTGLFYLPGGYADTEEIIALAREAARVAPGAIYDTHDRDLGASYNGIGFLASTAEAIRIGEASGLRVILSHFNPQGAHNYGRAEEGARLIDEARARGVEVWAAQHVYTATQSNLRSYAVPAWAVVGGDTAMKRRFMTRDTAGLLDVQTMEMLAIRGGADRLLFADPRPELNGRTLAQVAEGWGVPVPVAVRRILAERNAAVMNLDLYDIANTRYLATRPWMMTCTDGRTPGPGQEVTHPRVYGAFSRKLRLFVLDEQVVPMEFAIRSMTGLAADVLRLADRGYLRTGMRADLAVFERAAIADRATYDNPHQLSEGTRHVLVNGRFAIRDGRHTEVLAGEPIARPGSR